MNVTLAHHIAKHSREVFFGGNWTWVNLKDTLKDVTWQEATQKVDDFNTIVALTYHINYFISVVLKVLENEPLSGHDKFSFDHPPVNSEKDWQKLLDKIWNDAEYFAKLVEQLPESRLWENLAHEKYGSCYRNFHGIIEHTHYHLGQIVIIKKLIRMNKNV